MLQQQKYKINWVFYSSKLSRWNYKSLKIQITNTLIHKTMCLEKSAERRLILSVAFLYFPLVKIRRILFVYYITQIENTQSSMYITAKYLSKTDFVSYFEIWVLQVNERNIVGILKLDLDSKISKKK